MDLRTHLIRQIVFSRATFGPGERTNGVIDHIRKELAEIAAEETPGGRAKEWVDIVILALDGLWRSTQAAFETNGSLNAKDADEIAITCVVSILNKHRVNERREWPDWRSVGQDKAIEHKRD